MANRYLYAGGDLGSLRVAAGTPIVATTSSYRNTTYSTSATEVNSSSRAVVDFVDGAGASDAAVAGEKLWVHFSIHTVATSTVGSFVELLDGSDQPWLALRGVSSGVAALYYNSGTGPSPVWTQVGTATMTLANGTRYDVDIWITLGSPHAAGLASNNAQVVQGTFTQASLTSLDAVHLQAPGTNAARYSEVLATVGINTINGHVYCGHPNGAGSNSGWTGAYTDIDEAGIDDTDLISSGSAGQRSTFAYANLPALTAAQVVGDAFMWTRAKNDAVAPTGVKPVRRTSGGTDDVGTAFSGVTVGVLDFLTRYSGLTESEYNGSEFGVESAT